MLLHFLISAIGTGLLLAANPWGWTRKHFSITGRPFVRKQLFFLDVIEEVLEAGPLEIVKNLFADFQLPHVPIIFVEGAERTSLSSLKEARERGDANRTLTFMQSHPSLKAIHKDAGITYS